MNKENPFTEEYAKQELEFYGLKKYDSKHVTVRTNKIDGRCDDYLNVNFRTGEIDSPIMFIDGSLWMSLTFMELQSHWVPIRKAEGKVATAGLGLGYFTLKTAAKKSVKSIDVYEKEKTVIDFFKKNFKDREGFEKITFIHGDVREKMKGKQYDFVFVDIYQSLLPDELITDAELLRSNNDIVTYYPWGHCLVRMHAFEQQLDDLDDEDIRSLIFYWSKSKGFELRRVADGLDEEYIKNEIVAVEE